MPDRSFEYRWLGELDYEQGLRAQESALATLRSSPDLHGIILGLEHHPVITLGKRGRAEEDLLCTPAEIAEKGVELRVAERGGQATLHSPGQLVIYPCLSLARIGLGVRPYVESLQELTLEFLLELGIHASVGLQEPGLYTERGKICFFGLRISRDEASHGLALNVENDLELFSLIRSCGKLNERFDRVRDHGVTLPVRDLFQAWVSHFLRRLA